MAEPGVQRTAAGALGFCWPWVTQEMLQHGLHSPVSASFGSVNVLRVTLQALGGTLALRLRCGHPE